MRRVLAAAALLAVTATGCTLEEIATWAAWHEGDPAAAEEYAAQAWVQWDLHGDWDNDGVVEPDPPPPPPAPAVRLDAPSSSGSSGSSTSSGNRCTGYEGLLSQYGWDVGRMSQIMYRESRCQPGAANSCCTGLLQIHAIWIPEAGGCGVYSRSDLTDPAKNICTAAIIYRTQGMGAWSTS